MAEPEDAIWYVGIQGEQKGPFTVEAVKEMIAKGEVGQQDMVWNEGMTEWQPVSQTPEFATESTEAEPAAETAAEPKAPAGPNPVLEFLKSLLPDVRTIISDPDEGLKQVADKKPVPLAASCLGAGVIAFALLALPLASAFGGMMGSGTTGKVMLRLVIYAVVNYGIWFGLTFAAFAILRAKTGWQEVLTIVGLAEIPMVISALLVFVLAFLTGHALVLFAFAVSAKVLMLAHLFGHFSGASRRTVLYTIPILFLAVQAVSGVLFTL